MKKLTIIAMTVLALGTATCSKDQRRTNRLDGKWDVTHMELFSADSASSVSTNPNGFFEFQRCNLKKDSYCPYSEQLVYTSGSMTYTVNLNGEYRFDEEGNQLVLREFNEDGSVKELHFSVISFNRNRLEVENNDDGRVVYTLERM